MAPPGAGLRKLAAPERVIGRHEIWRVDPMSNEYIKHDATGPLRSIAWADRYGYTKETAFTY